LLSSAFGPNSIAIERERIDWVTAITKAIGLLQLDDRVGIGYLDEVLAANQELGPYFVVAPGIAIVHAKPSRSVNEVGFALLRLDYPVASGSYNDPVNLVFAFCATDAASHLDLLAEFATLLSSEGNVNLLLNASALSEIRDVINA
jgi:PTS system ascorbate-specific IIA component